MVAGLAVPQLALVEGLFDAPGDHPGASGLGRETRPRSLAWLAPPFLPTRKIAWTPKKERVGVAQKKEPGQTAGFSLCFDLPRCHVHVFS